jgi:hypothetical protein
VHKESTGKRRKHKINLINDCKKESTGIAGRKRKTILNYECNVKNIYLIIQG